MNAQRSYDKRLDEMEQEHQDAKHANKLRIRREKYAGMKTSESRFFKLLKRAVRQPSQQAVKTRRPEGTREWGYRLSGREYFVFIGSHDLAITQGRCDCFHESFEICEGRLTWREDERSDMECNPDDEWFICVGKPERITAKS